MACLLLSLALCYEVMLFGLDGVLHKHIDESLTGPRPGTVAQMMIVTWRLAGCTDMGRGCRKEAFCSHRPVRSGC